MGFVLAVIIVGLLPMAPSSNSKIILSLETPSSARYILFLDISSAQFRDRKMVKKILAAISEKGFWYHMKKHVYN